MSILLEILFFKDIFIGIEMLFWFVVLGAPWFIRGGALTHGVGNGVFAFANHYGNAIIWGSFRVVVIFTMIRMF